MILHIFTTIKEWIYHKFLTLINRNVKEQSQNFAIAKFCLSITRHALSPCIKAYRVYDFSKLVVINDKI